MKRLKSIVGVTLLEIMLVLAVAALVIVMSIRYYQSAQNSLAIQDLDRTMQAIMASADTYAASSGGYTGISPEAIFANIPANIQSSTKNAIKTPWGTATISASSQDSLSYTAGLAFSTNTPTNVCSSVAGFVNNTAQGHLSKKANCDTQNQLAYTYTSAAVSS